MAEQENIQAVRNSINAFVAQDWERYRATLTPDSVYDEKATQRRVQGADQVVQIGQGWLKAFPDARATVNNTVASGDTVVVELTWEGSQTGALQMPTGELAPSGRRVVVPAVEVCTVQDGKVKENRHYFDVMGMMHQLGAIPGV